jgi:hypothetical protein
MEGWRDGGRKTENGFFYLSLSPSLYLSVSPSISPSLAVSPMMRVVAVVRITVVVMVGPMMVVESEIMAATHHDEQHKAEYAQDNFSAHGQTSWGVSPFYLLQ